MNFKYFDRLCMEAVYDEVKVIGKDVELDGQYAHIMGMTLKDKRALVYVLEWANHSDQEEEHWQNLTDKTHRQQMKDSYKKEENIIFFRVREFHANGKVYEVAGANSSKTENYNMAEHMLIYFVMREHGWRMSEESPLYTSEWEHLRVTVIELRDDLEELPDWGGGLEVVKESRARTKILEIPTILTCGEHPVISFSLEDGTQAECYINTISFQDVWADFERRFQEEEYRNRILEQISLEEFQKMQEQYEAALLAACPRGKGYLLIEYECSAEVAVNFYAASYLDSMPQVHSGGATAFFLTHKSDKQKGMHGLKLRGCMIQTPIEPETVSLEAELFSYTELIKHDTETVY